MGLFNELQERFAALEEKNKVLRKAAIFAIECKYAKGKGLCWKCVGRLQAALAETEGE